MTQAIRRPHNALPGGALIVLLAVLLAACGSGGPSTSPPSSPSVAPTTPPATPAASASAAASIAAATPSPIPTSTSTATPAPSQAACQTLPQSGALPSDRFTEVRAETGPTADRLTFVFGNPSLPGPPTPPQGSLEVAQPPYTQAASGADIAMTGEHVLALRFTGMSLSNDVGQPTYDGPRELDPGFDAIRRAVLFDASEGQVGWYVGYDGAGCVTLDRTGEGITLTIDHG